MGVGFEGSEDIGVFVMVPMVGQWQLSGKGCEFGQTAGE